MICTKILEKYRGAIKQSESSHQGSDIYRKVCFSRFILFVSRYWLSTIIPFASFCSLHGLSLSYWSFFVNIGLRLLGSFLQDLSWILALNGDIIRNLLVSPRKRNTCQRDPFFGWNGDKVFIFVVYERIKFCSIVLRGAAMYHSALFNSHVSVCHPENDNFRSFLSSSLERMDAVTFSQSSSSNRGQKSLEFSVKKF